MPGSQAVGLPHHNREERDVEDAPTLKKHAIFRTALALDGAHHRQAVDQIEQGHVEGVEQLHESRGLQGSVESTAPADGWGC